MKIAVYGICKDEAKFAERFAKSAKDADGVYVLDTGSTDGTQAILKANGANVNEKIFSPFRFDLARNEALSLLPDDIDVAVSMDLDDILLPGWRDTIERNWEFGKTKMLTYPYIHAWEDEEQKIPRISIFGFKIHDPKSYFWKYPIHEILELTSGKIDNVKILQVEIVRHYPDLAKTERISRIDKFKDWMAGYEDDPRMVHLYGRELYFFKRWEEAIYYMKQYLKITKPYMLDNSNDGGVVQSRSYSCRVIAECMTELNKDINEVISWYVRSTGESPYQREPWMHLAYAWLRVGEGLSAYASAKRGMAITEKMNSIEVEGKAWDERADELTQKCKELMEKQANAYTNGIEGWMSENELVALNNLAGNMESIVEIGSWKGRSTHALLSGTKGRVYAVDHFGGSQGEELQHKEAFDNPEVVYKQFMENVGSFNNLEVIRKTSLGASKDFVDKSIDMVFIDGEHTYEGVKKDIESWLPKAKKIICGHDYNWPDIKRAVDEKFTQVRTLGSLWLMILDEGTVIPTKS
jgi:glycosyltransferase involved in cell wall biosynthesis/predicted O-methyltransferase YrrM